LRSSACTLTFIGSDVDTTILRHLFMVGQIPDLIREPQRAGLWSGGKPG
jgi:hypothetical protein